MLKPSMRDKKRYVAVEKSKKDVVKIFKKWYGLRNFADSNLKKIKESEDIEVYRVKPQYVERFRVVCMLVNKRIFLVSGTLKSLRKRMKEEHGYDI